jgi:murein DD-endopeptidase MepM/ murein hydrolase activator NlpD
MKRNHLTLVIQSASSATRSVKTTAQFSFHKRVILWCFLCVLLMVFFGARGSRAIIRNQLLRQDIAVLEASISQRASLEKKIEQARSEERRIRAFLGLDAGDEITNLDERLGMGGSASGEYDDMQALDPIAELDALVDKRPLHEQVYSLLDDLGELKGTLLQMAENLKSRPTIMPVQDGEVWMTSGFGWRKGPFTGLREFHSGVDLSGKKGMPILATAEGVVQSVGYDSMYGNNVTISHDARFETLYGHLLKIKVKEGEKVARGQVVGLMGSTGLSTGNHVHYEIVDKGKKVNPYNFILNRDNIKLRSSRG